MTRKKNSALGVMLLALGWLLIGSPADGAAQNAEGFLFQKPRVTLTVNMGYGMARAGSALFEEIDTLYTLGKSDFRSPVVGGSLAVQLNDRMDLALDLAFMRSSTWSEYVDWEEMLDNGEFVPIEQQTNLTRVPVTLSLRYYFMDRGRQISRFAWIPTTWAPYVGIGAGRMYYEFEQQGDFIYFFDESIYTDRIVSNGGAWTAHALAGAQYSLSSNLVLTAEGRYSWADAELDRASYSGYDPIDLSGFRGTVGIGVRF